MTAETCTTCGLPDELCVCDDVERSESTVTVTMERRSFDKPVTIIRGVESGRSDLSSDLKSQMACGGTVKNEQIELQGDHVDRVVDELEDRGFGVNVQ